ncbi:MAG: MBL fold metallo-hydrolase [Lamprobacter sp.]|uniref:MBL fold metallo-hydrolase n=1 Tax=Lamprobacter sp. TaxID=3100796 RepID=UPI002B2578E9|nr:MBL fold metallo-hydrolase [Lamprobacter sp.]MEA3640018.1 MBL fold metallo-hydrolase [Lamprobacter sp.]
MTANLRLTILFDNQPSPAGLTALWGFAALIETGERTLLFDTGSNGRVLLKHMAALGLSMASVDQLFLSHAHWDHMGGLDSVLEANPALSVVLHEGFSKHLIQDLHGLCREVTVVGAEPQTLAPGIISTGLLASQPPEQGLILNLGGLSMAISGCAHPGMEQIISRGRALLGEPIRWAIGGFHLMYADDAEITRSVQALQALGVTDVLPTHCTGDVAIAAFQDAYGDRCVPGGVGRRLEL